MKNANVKIKWNTAVCHCYSDRKKEVRKHLEKNAGVNIEISIANGEGRVSMNIPSTVDLHKVVKEFPIKDEMRKNIKLFLRPGESRQTPCAILKWNTAVCHCDSEKKKVRKSLEKNAGVSNIEINIANGEGRVTMHIPCTIDLHKVIKEFPIKEIKKNVKLYLIPGEPRQTPCVILKWNTAVRQSDSDQKKEVKEIKENLKKIGGVGIGEINIANGQGKVIMKIGNAIDLHTVIREFPTNKIRRNVTLFLKEN